MKFLIELELTVDKDVPRDERVGKDDLSSELEQALAEIRIDGWSISVDEVRQK